MKEIKTYYFDFNTNFGDKLNGVLISQLFNVKIVKENPMKSNLVGIGSLLDSYLHASSTLRLLVKRTLLPTTIVWGTGFIGPEYSRVKRQGSKPETFTKKMDFRALRGKLTYDRVQKIYNKSFPNIVLGDPGLLASKLINANDVTKKYKLGIIPHYVDANLQEISKIHSNTKDSTIIDILTEPIQFLTKLAECETILSSAMHGLIAADSLGIPNQRLIASDKITGGDYKFNDYYSVFNMDKHPRMVLNDLQDFSISINKIKEEYMVSKDRVATIQAQLIAAFPYK